MNVEKDILEITSIIEQRENNHHKEHKTGWKNLRSVMINGEKESSHEYSKNKAMPAQTLPTNARIPGLANMSVYESAGAPLMRWATTTNDGAPKEGDNGAFGTPVLIEVRVAIPMSAPRLIRMGL